MAISAISGLGRFKAAGRLLASGGPYAARLLSFDRKLGVRSLGSFEIFALACRDGLAELFRAEGVQYIYELNRAPLFRFIQAAHPELPGGRDLPIICHQELPSEDEADFCRAYDTGEVVLGQNAFFAPLRLGRLVRGVFRVVRPQAGYPGSDALILLEAVAVLTAKRLALSFDFGGRIIEGGFSGWQRCFRDQRLGLSLYSLNPEKLRQSAEELASLIDFFHLDVKDGVYVPGVSPGLKSLGPEVADVPPALQGLPAGYLLAYLKSLIPPGYPVEVHLMVKNPLDSIVPLANAGADLIGVHAGPGFLEKRRQLNSSLRLLRRSQVGSELYLDPDLVPRQCAASDLSFFSRFNRLVLMGVPPGEGGRQLLPEALSALSRLALGQKWPLGYRPYIGLDGGVAWDNVAKVRSAGADFVISGSGLLGAADLAAAAAHFRGD